jgi:hypothetical protein
MQLFLSFQNLSLNVDLIIIKRVSPGFLGFASQFRHGFAWRYLLGGLAGSTAWGTLPQLVAG